MKYSPFLLILLITVVSCESELTTSNNGNNAGERKLILSPKHLEGDQYVRYEFKARVTNVPLSDVSFYWDFDEGQGFEHLEGQIIHQTFYQDKVHNVRVRAEDYFSGELLGYDSIRVDIRPQVAFTQISPKTVDTILLMQSDGVMLESITFRIKASVPDHLIRAEWDFGDDTPPVFDDHTPQYSPQHFYQHTGSYTVRVTVRDTAGTYIGTDTAHVKIGFPQFGFSSFTTATNIGVLLAIDSAHPLKASNPNLVGPLSVGLAINGYLYSKPQFTPPNKFIVRREELGCYDNAIDVEFSDDLRTIKQLRIAVDDTQCTLQPGGKLEYGFELFDLELLAVTPEKIVYRKQALSVSDLARDIYFVANVANRNRGTFNARSMTEAAPAPSATVVILR